MARPRLTAALALSLLAACSHEAKRANPLDPELTPPVRLRVAVDDTAGTATLTWTPHPGPDFAGYVVLRQVFDRISVDTLARIASRHDTAFVDSTAAPETAYVYRVVLVTAAGLEVSSEVHNAGPRSLPAVRLTRLELDAPTASATLEWTPYTGPGFSEYRVQRAAEGETRTIAALGHVDSTRWRDDGLRGNTSYAYSVSVVTQRGHEAPGEPVSGRVHALVGSWPLEDGTEAEPPGVRLRTEAGGITALLSDLDGVRLRRYRPDGTVADEQALAHILSSLSSVRFAAPAAILTGDGTRLVAAWGGGFHGVVGYTESGVVEDSLLLAFPVRSVSAAERPSGPVELGVPIVGVGRFRELEIRDSPTSGRRLTEDFSFLLTIPVRDIRNTPAETETLGGWTFEGAHGLLGQWLLLGHGVARQADPPWPGQALSVRVDPRRIAVIALGGAGGPSLRLRLQAAVPERPAGEAQLVWTRSSDADTVRASFPGLWNMPVRVTMQADEDGPRAVVTYPVIQGQHASEGPATLAAIDAHSAWTTGRSTSALNGQTGEVIKLGDLSSAPSDTRTWRLDGDRRPRIAVCLPQEDEVRFGSVFRGSRWTDALRDRIGLRIGVGGTLFYPVSVDVGPDGRIYVLDAGHARVVVFDREGEYITEFGRFGAGEGEFDFGSGNVIAGGRDLTGSLAVDDDGFVYVADVGNRRIQKFAP